MTDKVSKKFIVVIAIAIFIIGLIFQHFLSAQGVRYSWLMTIVVMMIFGRLADRKRKKK